MINNLFHLGLAALGLGLALWGINGLEKESK